MSSSYISIYIKNYGFLTNEPSEKFPCDDEKGYPQLLPIIRLAEKRLVM